jgi:hypothetical protein
MQDLETEETFVPIPFAKLFADPQMAAEEIHEDIEHFTNLQRDEMGQLYRAIRKIKPKPEFKTEHAWVVDAMKEEMDYADAVANGTVDLVSDTPDHEFPDPSGGPTEPEEVEEEDEDFDDDAARKVAARSCILEFYQSEPTYKKKVSAAEIMGGEDEDDDHDFNLGRLSVSKALITAPELTSLLMHRRRFIKALKKLTLPGGLLTMAGGQYLIPIAFVARAKDMIDRYSVVRLELLEKFGEHYYALVEEAKKDLGSLFDPDDYPDFTVIKAAYAVHYRFVSNDVPDFLLGINPALFESESARVLRACGAAALLIERTNRKTFLKLVTHLADRLGMDEHTGGPKQLHSSVVDGVKEFLKAFTEGYDLTDDKDLATLVEEARISLDKLDAKVIREDPELRGRLKVGFEGVRDASAKLVKTALETRKP